MTEREGRKVPRQGPSPAVYEKRQRQFRADLERARADQKRLKKLARTVAALTTDPLGLSRPPVSLDLPSS